MLLNVDALSYTGFQEALPVIKFIWGDSQLRNDGQDEVKQQQLRIIARLNKMNRVGDEDRVVSVECETGSTSLYLLQAYTHSADIQLE